MGITIFFYIMAPLLCIAMIRLGFVMINDRFVKEVEEDLIRRKKFRFSHLLDVDNNIKIFIFGSFVIIFNLFFPKKFAKVLIKITSIILGVCWIVFGLMAFYIVLTEGQSIISDVKNDNWQ